MNNKFYLNVNNLGDYSEVLFNEMLKTADVDIQAIKISSDKTRFVIPNDKINFAYANVESNAKSIKLCFKEKPIVVPKEEKYTATKGELLERISGLLGGRVAEELVFEDKKFLAPNKSEVVLKSIYGDYMKIPKNSYPRHSSYAEIKADEETFLKELEKF